MTGEQAAWLRAHPGYRALSRPPSGYRWSQVGMLHAEGEFEQTIVGKRPAVKLGSFECGMLESIQRPQ